MVGISVVLQLYRCPCVFWFVMSNEEPPFRSASSVVADESTDSTDR